MGATDLVSTKQKFKYLEQRSNLVFRVEAFDAADVVSMRSFARTVTSPIGGCFLMIFHLIDGSFMTQTEATFHDVAQSKLRVFQAFASVFDVSSLDFFMSFSSLVGVTGNVGQSNYATSNALLDGELRKYPNAFSFVVPGISDVGHLVRSVGDTERSRPKNWSITSNSKQIPWAQGDALIIASFSATRVYQGWPSAPRCGNEVLALYSAIAVGRGWEGRGSFFCLRSSPFARALKFPWENTKRRPNEQSGLLGVAEGGC